MYKEYNVFLLVIANAGHYFDILNFLVVCFRISDSDLWIWTRQSYDVKIEIWRLTMWDNIGFFSFKTCILTACFCFFTGLGRLNQAEEYLAQAQWTVLKTPECSNAIKSKLYRNLGLLYAAKGEYEEALRQLADDVGHL